MYLILRNLPISTLCLIIVLSLAGGCTHVENRTDVDASRSLVRQLYPLGDSHVQSVRIPEDKAKIVNELMKSTAVTAGDAVFCLVAHPFPRHLGVPARIFQEKSTSEDRTVTVVVALHRERIESIILSKETDIPGMYDFLDQFVGRSAHDSFEVASGPTDLYFAPHKLSGLAKSPGLAKEIARTVKKMLLLDNVLF